tara:strand:+ start:5968 stop:6225 length:258 start_codon:yes stop_codon:yes gene_type:complete
MSKKLEILKKKILYRASYRGTKEMDILLSKFVNKYINDFNEILLLELEKFLDFEDEVILNYYQYGIKKKKIEENKISKFFKDFSV